MKNLCKAITRNPQNSASVFVLTIVVIALWVMGAVITQSWWTSTWIVGLAVGGTAAIVFSLHGLEALFTKMKEWCE